MDCDLYRGKGLPNSRHEGLSMAWSFFVGIEVGNERMRSSIPEVLLAEEGDALHVLLLTSLT
jgi:hypothetical protein